MRTRWIAGIGATCLVGGLAVLVPLASHAPRAAAAEPLRSFDGCAQLRSWYVREALPRVGPWGLQDGQMRPLGVGSPRVERAASAGEAHADTPAAAPVGNGGTGTNVQQHGVDEPDLAKTNGDIAVTVHGRRLRVYDVSGGEPRRLSQVRLGRGVQDELLLEGGRVVAIGQVSSPVRGGPPAPEPVEPQTFGRPSAESSVRPLAYRSSTVVTTVDVSDPATPQVLDRRTVDGSYVTAREHDGTVRVVVASQPRLPFVQPGHGLSRGQAEARNRQIVRDSTARDWLPTVDVSGEGRRPLVDCTNVRRPRHSSGPATTSILTLDPDRPGRERTVSVVADGSLVYASANRLYLATTGGGPRPWHERGSVRLRPGEWGTTQIYAFSTAGGRTSFRASGTVRGTVPGRWAMSAYHGSLRVASTRGAPWHPSETSVSVLQEEGDRLVVVGTVAGMGRTEQVRAVRWFGETAVVVTFRQTDPLYTLDLSDPAHPRVTGAVKLTGFSAYLHPLGDGLLLGLGQGATGTGRTTGAQVSVFDLSDPSAPRRVARLALGAGSFSPAEQDSRAFTYLPQSRLALVPTLTASSSTPQVRVIRVAADGALSAVRVLRVPGAVQDVRALATGDGRVVLVGNGAVQQVVDPFDW